MGSSLLALFVASGFGGQLGFWTILIAHIMFCLSFVVVTVQGPAGRAGRQPRAGGDGPLCHRVRRRSGGSPSRWCSRASSARRCCASRCPSTTSSSPTSTPATTTTFPMYVWGVAQRGVPMQVNVVGTLMFVISIVDRARWPRSTAGGRGRPSHDPAGVPAGPRAVLAGARAGAVLARRPAPPRARCRRCAVHDRADLVVVGGGYLGLWTALLAKERDPGRDVLRARGRRLRRRGERAQRRVLRGQPDPRLRQRPGPVARRAGRR